MKKSILWIMVAAVCITSSGTMAARMSGGSRSSDKCTYAPLQELIRDARSGGDIDQLIKNNVDLNTVFKCGGSVLQLAVLRGNPEIVKALLEGGARVDEPVSLEVFPIDGAPKQVSLLMFASYYAPRQDIVRLIISAGANVSEMDENGETVLWYMNQNPVLRNTDLSDDVRNALLYSAGQTDSSVQVPGQKSTMRRVVDPRQPAQTSVSSAVRNVTTGAGRAQQAIITKTDGGSVGQLPSGARIIQRSAYPTREIVEPDMPVKAE